MSDTPETPKIPKRPLTQAEMRAARLQSALRDNLRRRKAAGQEAQVPAVRSAPGSPSPSSPEGAGQEALDNEKGKQNES